MPSYGDFAYVYDRLMHEDIPYEQWADYIENLFGHYGIHPHLIADLACGTGNMTLPLAKRGYEMIGVDRSADMLSIAREKAQKQGLDILFLNQDMTKLDLYGTVDAFLCMIDGINYIICPHWLEHLFRRIKTCFLEPGGLLLFDLSTEFKLRHTLGDNTFVYDTEDLYYTWQNRYLEKSRLQDMFLTFFQKEGAFYRRFEERQLQRAYRPGEIIRLLQKCGFETVDVFEELSFEKPRQNSSRMVFAAR